MKINAQREKLRTGHLDTCEVPTQGNERISNIYKKKRKKEVNKIIQKNLMLLLLLLTYEFFSQIRELHID